MTFHYPKKTFYFIRHGVTEANQKKLWCGGDWDIELHIDGHKQAETLSNRIFEIKSEFDSIYTSPMLRAKQTAHAINSKSQKSIEILEGLREWRVGELEKTPWKTALLGTGIAEWPNPAGGESVMEFRKRVIEAITFCLENVERPLIVSHGAFCRVLIDLLNIPERHIENCTLYKISSSVSNDRILWELTDY